MCVLIIPLKHFIYQAFLSYAHSFLKSDMQGIFFRVRFHKMQDDVCINISALFHLNVCIFQVSLLFLSKHFSLINYQSYQYKQSDEYSG